MKEITVDLYDYFQKTRNTEAGILHCFLHEDEGKIKRPALLVIPGGAYCEWCFRENLPMAKHFFEEGFNTFYIDYSCGEGAEFPAPLLECGMAVLYIRSNAASLNITDKLAAIGFSAGGHLTGLLGNGLDKFCHGEFDASQRQLLNLDALIYCYPVVSTQKDLIHADSFKNLLKEKHEDYLQKVSLETLIRKTACPAFIFHCADDSVVPVGNSLALAKAYSENNIPFELHVFPKGGHGVAIPTRECWAEHEMPYVNEELIAWCELVLKWLKNQGFNH